MPLQVKLKEVTLVTKRHIFNFSFKDAEKILWSPEGTEYIIVSGSKVDVFRAKDSSKLSTLQLSKKLLAAALINVCLF